MKNLQFLIVLFLFICCSRSVNKPSGSFQTQALSIASEFALTKMDSATVITDDKGIVSIGDALVRYVINPESIYNADIDESPGKEILVTIDSLHDPYLVPAWHLVLKQESKVMKTLWVIRSDMQVLSINNGIISAEIPIYSPSSPLYYCSECRDTVEYQIINGELALYNNPVLN